MLIPYDSSSKESALSVHERQCGGTDTQQHQKHISLPSISHHVPHVLHISHDTWYNDLQ